MRPTARSLQHLRELSYCAEVAQKTIPRKWIKKDLFSVDIVALKPGEPVLAAGYLTRENNRATAEA